MSSYGETTLSRDTRVLADSLARFGIQLGPEIVRAPSQPVRQYAEQHILPRESASTPQGREVLA